MEFWQSFLMTLREWVGAPFGLAWMVLSSRIFISLIFIAVFFGATCLAVRSFDERIFWGTHKRSVQRYVGYTARLILGFVMHGVFYASCNALWGWTTYTENEAWAVSDDINLSFCIWLIPAVAVLLYVHLKRSDYRKEYDT